MSRPVSRSEPSSAQAARIASISAWAVGSWSSRVRLPARGDHPAGGGVDDHGADRRLGALEGGAGLGEGGLHVRGEAGHGAPSRLVSRCAQSPRRLGTGHGREGSSRADRQAAGAGRRRLAAGGRDDDRRRPGGGERRGDREPGADRHRRRQGERRRQAARRARAGAALALLQALGARHHRARREGARHGLRPPAGGDAAGGERRPARPQLRGPAAPHQRRGAEAAAGAALDRVAPQVPGAGARGAGRREPRAAAAGNHRGRRAVPADAGRRSTASRGRTSG